MFDLEVIDDYTFRMTFAGPTPFLLERLAHSPGSEMFHPKHYLQQYHPAYVAEAELDALVRAAGLERWEQLFGSRNTRVVAAPMHVDLPTLNSYHLAEKTSEVRRWERNPYYWKVDTEGNQLPYLDEVFADIVANNEVWNGKVIAGELDFAGRGMAIENYPLYRRYEAQGNYQTLLWNNARGTHVVVSINQNHTDEVLREIFQDVRFRRALSLGVDRDDINESLYFGQARPRQYTVLEMSRYYQPEFSSAYVDYDVERANELLDEMGLERGADGMRLRPDGQQLSFTIEAVDWESIAVPTAELMAEHWERLGIAVSIRPISGELQTQRATANLMDATTWMGNNVTDLLFPMSPTFIVPVTPSWEVVWGTEWARWFSSDGESGMEPPDQIKELRGWWEEILVEPNEERRLELGRMILEQQAENLWVIGSVGDAPFPIILRNTIGNFPEQGYWGWDTMWSSAWNPEQLFLR